MAKTNKFQKPNEDDKVSIDKRWRIPKADLVAPSIIDANNRPDKNRLDYDKLKRIVATHAEKLDDAAGIMELLPDLELVKETLVASILSPKDLKDVKLNIGIHKDAPGELAEIVRLHFTTVYDLESKLSDILAQSLFIKGCYILMPIPPKAISNLIKDNTYSLEGRDYLGLLETDISKYTLPKIGILHEANEYLWSADSYSIESFSPELDTVVTMTDSRAGRKDLIEISDNLLYLVCPHIKKAAAQDRIKNRLVDAYGLEGIKAPSASSLLKGIHKETNTNDINGGIYRNARVTNIPTLTFEPGKSTDGTLNPILLELPPECVLPVHIPGEPTNHVGYYIFLDEEGNPLHYTVNSNKFKELNTRLDNVMNNQTMMGQIGLGVTYGTNNVVRDDTSRVNKLLLSAYFDKFDKNLAEAVSKGSTGQTVEISNPGELYRIVFARQLEKQKTRIVYVPAEMITYIAFNYSEAGVGLSLIEKTKLYSSFRAILMFATIMASIKSSINRRDLAITLDEEDPDPKGTVEAILNEYVALQASGVPLGRLNPLDIIDSLQKSGLQVSVTGSNRYPATDIEVTESKREITPPDNNITDMLRDIHYSALWVNPETINKTADVDFATSITTANLLQAKRFQDVQQKYITHLSSFIQKYIYTGGPLFNDIKEKYSKLAGKCKLTLEEVIDSIEIHLPKADTAIINAQAKDYADYSTFVESAIDTYMNEGMIKDLLVGQNIGLGIEDVKAALVNLLKRQYLRSENMLPELDGLLLDPESNVDSQLNIHNDTIVKLVSKIIQHVHKVESAQDKIIQKLTEKLNGDQSGDQNTDQVNPDETQLNPDDQTDTDNTQLPEDDTNPDETQLNPDDQTDTDNTQLPEDDTNPDETDDDINMDDLDNTKVAPATKDKKDTNTPVKSPKKKPIKGGKDVTDDDEEDIDNNLNDDLDNLK